MLFNSAFFILIFLPIVLLGWYNIKKLNYRLFFLTAMSCFFYGYWDYRFVLLMMCSVCLDYFCGKKIFELKESNHAASKRWMVASIIINLCILSYFKYFNFFIDSFYTLLPNEYWASRPLIYVVLPVGISFYIFESMTYSIDIYKGIAKPASSILHLSTYISMFPRLCAGPIVRYSQIEEQLKDISSKINFEALSKGLFIFSLGLFRKLYIADTFAEWADFLFENEINRQFWVSWAGVLSYTLQIYFDFSAYSEMAFGLGIMLGFEFPKNFNSPYKSYSFSDFWKRWHIALSEFLRDYLYISLGGNKKGKIKTYRNLLITMLLGGLWHGASWMFIIWGGLHALYLIIERVLLKYFRFNKSNLYRVIVFIAICIAWIFFRSNSLGFAFSTLKSCLGLNGFEMWTEKYLTVGNIIVPEFFKLMGGIKHVLFILLGIVLVNYFPNTLQLKFKLNGWYAILVAVILFACLLKIEQPSPFIYFQF